MNIIAIFVFSLSISIGEFLSVPEIGKLKIQRRLQQKPLVSLSMDDSLIKPNAENNWKKQHRIDLSNIKSENQLIQGDKNEMEIKSDVNRSGSISIGEFMSVPTRFVRESKSSNPSILCRVVSIHSVLKSEKKYSIS